MQEEFSWTHPNGMQVKRLSCERIRHLYDGHEVASHTLTHPYMHELSDAEVYRQLKTDKDTLEALFCREVKGFAVPFDYYDDHIANCAKACGFTYARKSECTGNFTPCSDAFHWKSGIYHIDPNLTHFVAAFLNTNEELAVCQIVGHSYDLDAENLWGTMELICAAVSKCDDIWLCTNAELVEFFRSQD